MENPHRKKVRLAVYLVIVLLSVSCRTLSPLTVAPETSPQKFGSLEEILPRWQPFAENISPGIDYFEGSIRKPRLRFWALRVDLTEPALRIVVNGKESAGNADGIIPSTKVSSFVRRYDCLAGINTNPFDPVSGKEGEARTVIGINVSEGKVTALPVPRYDGLVFYTDGKAAIVSQAELPDMENSAGNIRNAVGGFHRVLQDGAVSEAVYARGNARHPRSAAGLSSDGQILYLLAIDGRRLGSRGAVEAEIGIILQKLGADDGLNLDGGGSTALALKYPDGKVRVVNTPIHQGIPGWERAVAACLGIAPNAE
ncbi:MAG: phosphodiester glycosidase family protein [Treponema sp.]|nr:phosphodiester glycosidase family protein [Treponema sp.]